MTYAQLEQLRALASARIATKIAELMPSSGRGISVNAGMITVTPTTSVPRELPEPDWDLFIFGRVRVTFGGELSDWSSWTSATGVFRDSGEVWGTAFWEDTQILSIPQPEGPILTRSFTLELQSRGVRAVDRLRGNGSASGDEPIKDATRYFLPVRLTLGEYRADAEHDGELVRTHTLDIRRAGVSVYFAAQEQNQFNELRPLSITRI